MADDSTGTMEHSEATSPGSPYMGPLTPSGRRVRKVSALSDFAPVNQIVKRWVPRIIALTLPGL